MAWQQFIREARKRWKFRHYVRALENGEENGLKHYMVAITTRRWIPHGELCALAKKHGYGWVSWVNRNKGDARKVASYMTKYFTKEGTKGDLPRGARRITCSRGALPTWEDTNKARRAERRWGAEEDAEAPQVYAMVGHRSVAAGHDETP